MTQEERELLIKDLCARIPYGVRGVHMDRVHYLMNVDWGFGTPTIQVDGYNAWFPIDTFMPYLRPISSITQEEYKEFNKKYDIEYNYLLNGKPGHTVESVAMNAFEIDFYNSHHIDYRGLIEKGLVLKAPADMYKQIKQ